MQQVIPKLAEQIFVSYECNSDKPVDLSSSIHGKGDLIIRSTNNSSVYVHSNLFSIYIPENMLNKENRRATYYTCEYGALFLAILSNVYIGKTYKMEILIQNLIDLLKDVEIYTKRVPNSPIIPYLGRSLHHIYACSPYVAQYLLRYGYFSPQHYDTLTIDSLVSMLDEEKYLDVEKLLEISRNATKLQKTKVYLIIVIYCKTKRINPQLLKKVELTSHSFNTLSVLDSLMKHSCCFNGDMSYLVFSMFRKTVLNTPKEEQERILKKTQVYTLSNCISALFKSLNNAEKEKRKREDEKVIVKIENNTDNILMVEEHQIRKYPLINPMLFDINLLYITFLG